MAIKKEKEEDSEVIVKRIESSDARDRRLPRFRGGVLRTVKEDCRKQVRKWPTSCQKYENKYVEANSSVKE